MTFIYRAERVAAGGNCDETLSARIHASLRSASRLSNCKGESLGCLARFPFGGALERFNSAGFVEMDHRVELFGQTRTEVVAHALRLRTVDHSDRAFQPRVTQASRQSVIVTQ